MEDQRLKEYIEYYEVRMKKYANNPLYKNTYEAEKNLYEAIKSCNKLEEFKEKEKQGNLSNKCAIALAKDQAIARLEHFKSIKEFVRAKASAKILEIIDSIKDVNELVKIIGEIETKNAREISIDLFTDQFYSDFRNIENIEDYEKANLPEKWAEEAKGFMKRELDRFQNSWENHVLPENRKWKEGWDLDYKLIWEERHRRKIPVPDEVVTQRIEDHKRYRGIK